MTRRLVARERAWTASPSNGATAVHRAGEGVYQGFCRWFGPSGSDALFLRALAHVRPAHPALADLRLRARPGILIELRAATANELPLDLDRDVAERILLTALRATMLPILPRR